MKFNRLSSHLSSYRHPFFFFFQVIPAICLHHEFIYFPKLWLWFPITINDADWPLQPITCVIKDDSELHYGPSFLLLSILYTRFNKHVIPNWIFLQISSWTHCATLTDGKKCLAWHNYLNYRPQCLMRTLPLCDIPGGIFPLQRRRHFRNRWELYCQSACWSMTSKCCSNSFCQCWFTCFVCLLEDLIIVLKVLAPGVFDFVPLVH